MLCGEVEVVVGALTPVGRGIAKVFHDLLVELRLLLVAEVEEGEEEEGQLESLEVDSGVQSEEVAHMDGMWMTVSGVRTKARTWANVSVDEMCKAGETLRAFSGCTCGCACCEAPRNRWCAVSSTCQRRHWCSHRCAFGPTCCCPRRSNFPCFDTVSIHPTLSRSHFSHMFSLCSHGILGVVFTCFVFRFSLFRFFLISFLFLLKSKN